MVTHHMPSYSCITDYYKGNSHNCYFAARCDDIIAECKPKLWIGGHTHSSININLGKMAYVANPVGYPSESEACYDPVLILDTNYM